ncbi:DUF1566 domain-containing protein [candidate division KSB1 bacterium]|nr:DUF1566 domain-containing protein [candidate division KSB1 bacterium]
MSKKKKPLAEAQPENKNSPHQRRFEWWKLLLPMGLTLLLARPWEWRVFESETPAFAPLKPIVRPDSGIVFIARNGAADRSQDLDVEFDSLLFAGAGRLLRNTEPQQWLFSLAGRDLPEASLRDGSHSLRVGFAGDALCAPLVVKFSSQGPVVQAAIEAVPGRPEDRQFRGLVASKLQDEEDTLKVEVAFHNEGRLQQASLPVKRVTDLETGVTYFEFETTIQGLPKIAPEDTRYGAPFFAFRVTDAAGNRYYHQQSYAQFMAPGDNRFGVNSIADIEVKRLPPDLRQRTTVAIRLVPKPITQLANGSPALVLKVESMLGNLNQLDWTDLPPPLRSPQPLTFIYRNEEQVAIAFGNQYVDEKAPANAAAIYRVEQEGRDGQVYSSNSAQAGPGKEPSDDFLSVEEAQRMIIAQGFYDRFLNPKGEGVRHQYDVIERDGEKLVIDRATNLTWQQSASSNYMTFEKARAYVAEMNAKGFAGYRDWRLPTLEEGMSLMERGKKNGDLYIAPVFDSKQRWIWTSDKQAPGAAWVVLFNDGGCGHNVVGNSGCVRLVR